MATVTNVPKFPIYPFRALALESIQDSLAGIWCENVINQVEIWSSIQTILYASLRCKRFRAVSEQRKTEERDSRFWPREK